MSSTYDALGRETRATFWDGRSLTTLHEGWNTSEPGSPSLRPEVVTDSGVAAANGPEVGHREVLRFHYEKGLLTHRNSGLATSKVTHVPAPRPSMPGKSSGSGGQRAETRFQQDERGILDSVQVLNGGWDAFAGVQMRYDRAGNPVIERRSHQGGLSRVMQYDFASRLTHSVRGHLLDAQAIPGVDLADTSAYISSPGTVSQQWQRHYPQDDVDNIIGIQDYLNGNSTPADNVTLSILDNKTNLVESRSDTTGVFGYDPAGRLTYDPTTGLSYEYNWRGQIAKVKNISGSVVRAMTYDAFGRMVHQVEASGTPQERGTIFVPNLGFGGEGAGADTAAEISYTGSSGVRDAVEILQFTYGPGAIGGGIGWKRLVEFVAYARDFAPYFRFLHEDTMGNTIATTSLWGDRLDEYDYTDYGVPIHAPVALDGRWITNIDSHNSYADVSVVTLYNWFPEVHELFGCELRVVKSAPASADDVYLTGTVISHRNTTLYIDDLGHAIADAWQGNELAKDLTAVYDLREGFTRGVMDHAQTGTYSDNGWPGVLATFIRADHGPFDLWMSTQYYNQGNALMATVGPDASGNYSEFKVLGVWQTVGQPIADSRYQWLVLEGDVTAWCGPGKRFEIDGKRDMLRSVQSGRWAEDALGTDTTTFKVHEYAWLSENMKGWMLQPDVNSQVYLPITEADPSNHTVTVRGNYESLGDKGTSFRIHAPPGTQTDGADAGMLSRWVGARSSRCLFGGYRYESPLAGLPDWSQTGAFSVPPAVARQDGDNFAGLHYTLFRHYDPVLMRFTSPDPAAQFFYNLHSYGMNSPARYHDPDGDFIILIPALMTFAIAGAVIAGTADAAVQYSEHQDRVEAGETTESFSEAYDVGRGAKWSMTGGAIGVVTFHVAVTSIFAWQVAPAVFAGGYTWGARSAATLATAGTAGSSAATVLVTRQGARSGGGPVIPAAGTAAQRTAATNWYNMARYSSDKLVIGRVKDVQPLAGTPGQQILQIGPRVGANAGANYTKEANMSWLQGGVDRGASFRIATDINQRGALHRDLGTPAVLSDEIDYLLMRGYELLTRGGVQYMVPGGK